MPNRLSGAPRKPLSGGLMASKPPPRPTVSDEPIGYQVIVTIRMRLEPHPAGLIGA